MWFLSVFLVVFNRNHALAMNLKNTTPQITRMPTTFAEYVEACMEDSECIKYFTGEKKLKDMPILGVIECLQDGECARKHFSPNHDNLFSGDQYTMSVFGPMIDCLLNPDCEMKNIPTTSTTSTTPPPRRPRRQKEYCTTSVIHNPFSSHILCGQRLRQCIPYVCEMENMTLCGPPGTTRIYLGMRRRKRHAKTRRRRHFRRNRTRAADRCCSKTGCTWNDLKKFCC